MFKSWFSSLDDESIMITWQPRLFENGLNRQQMAQKYSNQLWNDALIDDYYRYQRITIRKMYQQVNELLAALNQFDQIRYAAYRTAAKLRFVQKNAKLDCVKLTHVLNVVDKFGLRPTCERELLLTTEEMRPVIQNIFSSAQKETLVQLSPKISTKIVLELLIQTFDKWVVGKKFIVEN